MITATIPAPITIPRPAWPVRTDPFSSHRAGFEVRTYRLCRRVLMFHHFAELGIPDYLVRSTDFDYTNPADLTNPVDLTNPNQPGYTVLQSVTHRSYQENPNPQERYVSRRLPRHHARGAERAITEIGLVVPRACLLA